jgi:hypothetical protein
VSVDDYKFGLKDFSSKEIVSKEVDCNWHSLAFPRGKFHIDILPLKVPTS